MSLHTGLSKIAIVVAVLAVAVSAVLVSVFVTPTERRSDTETVTPRQTPTTPRSFFKPTAPTKTSEDIPKAYLPQEYEWSLWVGDPGGSSSYPESLPRSPSTVIQVNVSANILGMLARPLISSDLVFLADTQGVYALRRSSGELVWGIELYFNHLRFRESGYPQPVSKWRALGLDRFVKSYGVGKHVYVATSSSATGGNALLLALDKRTGNIVWRVELAPEPGVHSSVSISSNTIVAEGLVFVGSLRDEGYVFCVAEEGRILWRRALGGNMVGLAYGNGVLYAVSKALYAINSTSGNVLWVYQCSDCSAPIYRDGYVFVVEYGRLIALSATSGEVVWRKDLGIEVDKSGTWHDPYVAVGREAVYSSRGLGSKPLSVFATDFKGSVLWEFTVLPAENPSKPIAASDVVLLPVRGVKEVKVYVLWRSGQKLYEIALPQKEEGWMPVISAAYGEIHVLVDSSTLYILRDNTLPEVLNISVELKEVTAKMRIEAVARDRQSSIYRVLLVYSINCSKWLYRDMNPARTYLTEPVGGYGYIDEPYAIELEVGPGTSLEFYIVIIDRVGNYIKTEVRAYKIHSS